jgi:putative phosphoribosyl transferase
MNEIFLNRADAGRQLATRLAGMRGQNVVVLGLPRGGVPVAAEVAAVLEAPLDVIVVRKLGVPFQPEVAMGAIGEDGVRILDHRLIEYLGITPEQIEKVERTERAILAARIVLFRSDIERQDLTGRTALIVDDGIATGSTASVACRVARGLGAARVVVAAPVGGPDSVQRLRDADEVICLIQPDDFVAVGAHYRDFRPTSETEVVQLLAEARRREDEAGR